MQQTQTQLQLIEPAAKRLGVSKLRFYELVRRGVLPPGVVVRLGRHIRVNPTRLEAFIDSGGASLPGGWRKEAV
jgi:excisionase family DNA binding protein